MPRAGLSAQVLVERAGDIADREGLDGLTLAALAQSVGVRQPSLYKHVDGLADLRHRLAIDAKRRLTADISQAVIGLSGLPAVVAFAAAYRRWAITHPGRFAAAQPAPDPADAEDVAASAAATDVLLAVLRGCEISASRRIDAARAIRSAVQGFVAIELAGGFDLPRDIEVGFTFMIESLVRGMASGEERSAGVTG